MNMAYVSGEAHLLSMHNGQLEMSFNMNVPRRAISRNGPNRRSFLVLAMGDTPFSLMADAVMLAEFTRDFWEPAIDARMVSHDGCPCSTVSQAR